MSVAPEPPLPPDCDLRGYDWMPLYGHRLFASDFYLQGDAEAFRAGVRLWWAAWQGSPAASLPADDAALARLADFGRDLEGWLRVKELALRGFVQCADGRLYHLGLAELALEAWDRRKKERDRKAAFRARLRGASAGQDGDAAGTGRGYAETHDEEGVSAGQDADNGDASAGQDGDGTRMSRQKGEDRTGEEKKERIPLTPTAGAAGAAPPAPTAGAAGELREASPGGDARQVPRNSRAHGTNPRAMAAAEAGSGGAAARSGVAEAGSGVSARRDTPAPSSPLWSAFQVRGVGAAAFTRWIEPLRREDDGGTAVFRAPSKFHASQVRSEYGHMLRLAVGGPVEVVGPGELAPAG